MSSDNRVNVNVSERKIGKAAGKAVGDRISSELRSLSNKLENTNEEVRQLRSEVEDLESRISEIEQVKARAERDALEELTETLQEELEEKRAEYENRVRDVVADYRSSIERLKNRFLNSISGQRESFGTVESEFQTGLDARDAVRESSASLGEPPVTVYDDRASAVAAARDEYLDSIDEFLGDREETASTIESLQTPLDNVDGETGVTVPFWVVGVEIDGEEEIRVLPVMTGTDTSSPSRGNPFADPLEPHPVHGYTDIADQVQTYVSRQESVRDAVAAEDDGAYYDPQFMQKRGFAKARFVEALKQFSPLGDSPAPSRDGQQDTRQTKRAKEVATND